MLYYGYTFNNAKRTMRVVSGPFESNPSNHQVSRIPAGCTGAIASYILARILLDPHPCNKTVFASGIVKPTDTAKPKELTR